MFSINHTDYGLRVRLSGTMSAREIDAFSDGMRDAISVWTNPFAVFVDMRDLEPLGVVAQQGIIDIHAMGLKAGAMRSVVILNNSTTMVQFKRIALQTNVYEFERYLDATAEPNWEEIGLKWLTEGIDPDAEWREEVARGRENLPTE